MNGLQILISKTFVPQSAQQLPILCFKHGLYSYFIPLQGGRELDDFIKYIAKEATTELKGWDRKGKAKKTEL